MGRLMLFIIASGLLGAVAPATAQSPTCTVEHITGDQCQGPDIEGQVGSALLETLGLQGPPGDNFCSVGVWVQKATCEVSVPGGVTTNAGIGWTTNSDGDDPVTYHIVLRDAQSGTVLYDSGEQTSGGPFMGVGPWNTNGGNGAGTVIQNVTTDKVICEITGTHSIFGATYLEATNSFSCTVNN